MADLLADKSIKEDEAQSYGAVLQKLLPVEVTAAYLALRALFNQQAEISKEDVYLLFGFALALAALFFPILKKHFGVESPVHRLFYCGCFLVWAANIETDKIAIAFYSYPKLPLIIGGITILVSFGVPYWLRPVKPA